MSSPEGFEELEKDRRLLVDIYYGGHKVGETLVTLRPGYLKFVNPEAIPGLADDILGSADLLEFLKRDLPLNAGLVCHQMASRNCGNLLPELAGIIYDEEHFRVDLFVNPRFRKTFTSIPKGYLPVPSGPVSLTSVIGVAAAGTFNGRGGFNIQNRTVAGFRNGRIRTSNAIASGIGWIVDDLVAEIDHRSMRYSAGLLWAPGDDFTGQRRILGGGFNTQFDTSSDRELLQGTPLVIFLSRPAQVELFVDGRLLGSKSYLAGNNEVDTSGLSDGSYVVTLRIYEEGGSVREEKRFFVKNAQVAPVGRPIIYGYAGLLATTGDNRPVAVSSSFYYRAGAALRLDRALAVDLSTVGTGSKAIAELGAWLLSPALSVRVAGLVSTQGDVGSLVQLAARNAGPFNLSLDVRRIWSANGQPLLPLSTYVQTFDSDIPLSSRLATGSLTQATGTAALRIGSGSLSMIGTYRRDGASKADYSLGPSVSWPLANKSGLQVLLQASAVRSRTGTAAFATFRVLTTRGRLSVMSAFGQAVENNSTGRGADASRPIGSLDAQYALVDDGQNVVTGQAGIDRDLRSTSVRGGATYSGTLGNARVELRQQLEGSRPTRYDVNFQTGLAVNHDGLLFGSRQPTESAILVSVAGEDSEATFRVLLDDTDRGHVRAGERLSLFLPAYRTYRVRVLPIDAPAVEIDSQAREVTLYPGSVASLTWRAERYSTLFAQAVLPDGQPIARALVQTMRNIAETDDQGYFQINLHRGDLLRFSRSGAEICKVITPAIQANADLISAGKVVCK